jgi:class 3 adenylate cyclase
VSFSEDIDQTLRLLRVRGRVSLRAIALELGADVEYARSIRDEIVDVLGLARDDGAGVLTAVLSDVPGSQAPFAPPRRDERLPATAERRLLTSLFCDLVSSTPLSTRLDPEDLRELMLNYQSVCTDAIERLDGHISQWIGDGVVAYFGFPEAHEDDAVRALHASLAIVDAAARQPAAADGSRIAVRLGVHTGWSIVGDQSGGRRETLAFGEAPNVCARIQACAEPNTVVVSETTFALTKGFFEFVDLNEFDLKGVGRRIRLYRAVGPTGAGDRFDVVRDEGLIPLVDRAREQNAVSSGWLASTAGDSRALLIAGEAGIGKSRVVHFARQLVAKPAQVLEFRGSPYHRLSSLRAVSGGLRRFWELDRLPDGEIQAAIAARLEALVTEPFAAPLLQDLLGARNSEPSGLGEMPPAQIRALTFELIGGLVSQISNSAPLLLIVEDMHWLDPSSEELLRLLLQRREGSKAFFPHDSETTGGPGGSRGRTSYARGPSSAGIHRARAPGDRSRGGPKQTGGEDRHALRRKSAVHRGVDSRDVPQGGGPQPAGRDPLHPAKHSARSFGQRGSAGSRGRGMGRSDRRRVRPLASPWRLVSGGLCTRSSCEGYQTLHPNGMNSGTRCSRRPPPRSCSAASRGPATFPTNRARLKRPNQGIKIPVCAVNHLRSELEAMAIATMTCSSFNILRSNVN